ncbi:hypothetical protein FBU31_006431 [Coemansia sp. 'formosensis']|nr:hypothetical protein FBU31_006431 [Coemansia sp. 'formosensis']
MPPAIGQRQRSSINHARPPPELSPLSPAESAAALASSPPGSHRSMHLSVDTSAAALMSPPPVPGSAFTPYDSHGHAKNQIPSLHHQHQTAIFIPSGTVAAAAASAVYPHLVSIASTDAAELFGTISSGNTNVGSNGGLL